jgi:hypothetical protein
VVFQTVADVLAVLGRRLRSDYKRVGRDIDLVGLNNARRAARRVFDEGPVRAGLTVFDGLAS